MSIVVVALLLMLLLLLRVPLLFIIVKLVSEATFHRGDSLLGRVLELLGQHFGMVLNLLAQSLSLTFGSLGELGLLSGEEFLLVLDRFLEGLDGLALFPVGGVRGMAVRSARRRRCRGRGRMCSVV